MVIFTKATKARKPTKTALNHPATREDNKACRIIREFDDLNETPTMLIGPVGKSGPLKLPSAQSSSK